MGSGIYESDSLVLAENQSLGASFNTPRHETRYHDMGAIQLWYSGVNLLTGQFIVQFSLDDIHWSDSVDITEAATLCAASGTHYFEFTAITAFYWRVKYIANTTTTGIVTILSCIKRRR